MNDTKVFDVDNEKYLKNNDAKNQNTLLERSKESNVKPIKFV